MVASKSGQSLAVIISVLEKMERDGLLTLQLQITDAMITFVVPREDDKTINPLTKEITLQKEKKASQVNAVIHYIENDTLCKSVQLLRYFGEQDALACRLCSVCKKSDGVISAKEKQLLSEKIMIQLEEGPQTSRELSEKLIFAETDIIKVIRLLLDKRMIQLDVRNRYHLK